MTWPDFLVIVGYLAIVIAVNQYWAGRVDFADWLTSKNAVGWKFVTFTMVSTNVGAGTMLGTAGSTFHDGIGWGVTGGVGVMFGFWVMAWFARTIRTLTPAGERSSFQSFFRLRYARRVRILVGVIVTFLYFFYLAAQFKGLGAILEVWGGWNTNAASLVAALLVVWLTANSGIRSDMYTDVLHFWAMFLTTLAAAAVALVPLGGIAGMRAALVHQGVLDRLMNPYTFAGASYVWMGILVGAFLGLPAMEDWQRIDVAKTDRGAVLAMFWAGILNAFFFAAAALLGLAARATLAGDVPSNHVLFELVRATLPPGLVGLAVVGAFAAFMSTANSMLTVAVNSILCEMLYVDEERLTRQKGILRTGRWLTWGVGAAGLLIASRRPDIVSLILTGLWGSGVLIPAIVGGLYWRRSTSAGAFWSILVGFVLTFVLAYVPQLAAAAWLPGPAGAAFRWLAGMTPAWAQASSWPGVAGILADIASDWPDNSWIPGLTVGLLAFVGISLATRHDRGERLTLAR